MALQVANARPWMAELGVTPGTVGSYEVWFSGEVSEWLKEHAWKVCIR